MLAMLIQITADQFRYARNFQFLTYGLIAAWLVLLIYVVLLGARENKVRRELDRVRLMVEDKEHAGEPRQPSRPVLPS